jgi:hypothetical protein
MNKAFSLHLNRQVSEILLIMKTAREKFKKGDRVWMSMMGMDWLKINECGRGFHRPKGVIAGVSYKSPYCVQIVQDGQYWPQRYHMDFWTKIW